MAKRRRELPLTIISPSECNRFTRSRSRSTSGLCHCKGKENATPGSCQCKRNENGTPATKGVQVVPTGVSVKVADEELGMKDRLSNLTEQTLPDCEEICGVDELRGGALHLHKTRVTAQEAVAATPQVPTEGGSLEKSTRKRKAPSGYGVSRKGSRRQVAGSCPSKITLVHTEVRGRTNPSRRDRSQDSQGTGSCPSKITPVHTEVRGRTNPSRRDRSQDSQSTECCVNVDRQEQVARATDALQDAYCKLYKKYRMLKIRNFSEAKDILDEQSKKNEAFSTAAEALMQDLLKRNQALEETISRSRLQEEAYIECQNALVMEQSKNFELQQELEQTGPHGGRLLHELLQSLTELNVSVDGESSITFSHDESGLEFTLERNKLSEEVGGKDALFYQVVTPGTVLHLGPEWMQSEIIFDVLQVNVFLQRIMGVILCRG